MLRKFPPQTPFGGQPMYPPTQNNMPLEMLDKDARRDFFGERLFSKISTNVQFGKISDFYSKIVGIFLDLQDHVIERLLQDDQYFVQQVSETVRVSY
jgi:hypothetical protein